MESRASLEGDVEAHLVELELHEWFGKVMNLERASMEELVEAQTEKRPPLEEMLEWGEEVQLDNMFQWVEALKTVS